MLARVKITQKEKKLLWKNNFRSNKCSKKFHKSLADLLQETA